MKKKEIRNQIYSVGVLNPTLRTFDVFMRTEYGSTYNVYVVKGENKTALIESVNRERFDEFFENLKEVINPAEIDYIILNHTEPDHSGSLAKILEYAPNAVVVATATALRFLKNIVNQDFPSLTATEDLVLDLGKRSLHFKIAPNLHWPDSMFTYLPEEKMIFTCDFLGAHYCESPLELSKIYKPNLYEGAFRFYYDCIFSPFKKFVLAGLNKMDGLDIEFLAPSHGPALDSKAAIEKAKSLYREWSTEKDPGHTATIVYVSAYGYTKKLALEIAEELKKEDFKVSLFDLSSDDFAKAAEAALSSKLLFIGSSTINRNALPTIWNFLTGLDAIALAGKPVGVFGSYGWSGEAVPALKAYLTQMRCKVVGEGFKAVFQPSETELAQVKEYAKTAIELIKKPV